MRLRDCHISALLIVTASCFTTLESCHIENPTIQLYPIDADSLKIKAAEFLTKNMFYQSYPYNNAIANGKVWFEKMRSCSSERLIDARDSLLCLLDLGEPIVVKRDLYELDSSYLRENIDLAFKVWQEQPWGKNIDFEMFCEYILPYRIGDEIPVMWRKKYYDLYNPLLDEFRDSGYYDSEDPVEAVKFLLQKLPFLYNPIYASTSFMAFPHIGPDYVPFMTGSCREFSDYLIYVCRALGIPCAFNGSKNMHRENQGHQWASFWNKDKVEYIISNYPPELVPNSEDYTMGAAKCKVRRATFSLNKDIYKRGRRNRRELVPEFRFPLYKDVTEIYTDKCVQDVHIPLKLLTEKIQWKQPVYICSPNRDGWTPEDFAFRSFRQLDYFKLQPGEIMCLCVERNGKMQPVSSPFRILGENRGLDFLNINGILPEVILKSKFTDTEEEQMFRERMKGGVFEVSDNMLFSNPDTLYEIVSTPDRKCTRVSVENRSLRNYSFVRYKGPDGSYCNVSEVTFYDSTGNAIKPISIIGTSAARKNHDYQTVFDEDTKTSFDWTYPSGGWSGIEMKKGTRIAFIEYVPRNRDNYINAGDIYELLYFDGCWKSLGTKTATSDTLVFTNVPNGCLLILKDYSNGVQERVFTYESGRQVWW